MNTSPDTAVNHRNYQRLGYVQLLRGIYAPALQPTGNQYTDRRQLWLAKAKAALAHYADGNPVLWGPSALQAMGVALPSGAEDWDQVHILVDYPKGRSQRDGVVSHDGLAGRPIWRYCNGLPVLHPVDHWLQMAGLSDDDMILIGDGFLRRKNPLLTKQDMLDRLAQLEGHHGVKQARRVIKLVREGTDSIYESKTRLVLYRAGLPMPQVNPAVWCEPIDYYYHVDLGYIEEQVGIEFDGQVHVGDTHQMNIDADRRRHLQDAGWIIINVTAARLREPAELIRSVENALILRRTGKNGR